MIEEVIREILKRDLIFLIIAYSFLLTKQLIWLYYENTKENQLLFIGHKLIMLGSFVCYLVFPRSMSWLFLYGFLYIFFIKWMESKKELSYVLKPEHLFLVDTFYMMGVGILLYVLGR